MPRGPRPTMASGRGFALIIVLWSLVLLTAIATQLTATGRAEARLASNLRGAAMAQAAADGCVHQVLAELLAGALAWPPDPAPRVMDVPGARAVVRLGSEDGKLDLNSVPPEVLARALRAVGAGSSEAQQLALDVALWRFPSAQTTERRRAYAAAGLAYAPPGAPFQSVTELSLVLGMTPAILERLRPHVTVLHEGDPDVRFADEIVRAILAERGVLAEPPNIAGRPTGTATIDVLATVAGGSRAARHAVVRLGSQADRGGWAILVWE